MSAQSPNMPANARSKRSGKDLEGMRAYAACYPCRKRKTACSGKPPCARCLRNNKPEECILGTSNRGGKRVKKVKTSHDGGPTDMNSPMGTGSSGASPASVTTPREFPSFQGSPPEMIQPPSGGYRERVMQGSYSQQGSSPYGEALPRIHIGQNPYHQPPPFASAISSARGGPSGRANLIEDSIRTAPRPDPLGVYQPSHESRGPTMNAGFSESDPRSTSRPSSYQGQLYGTKTFEADTLNSPVHGRDRVVIHRPAGSAGRARSSSNNTSARGGTHSEHTESSYGKHPAATLTAMHNPNDAIEVLKTMVDDTSPASGDLPTPPSAGVRQWNSNSPTENFLDYQPFIDGQINQEQINGLFSIYASKYHLFFPFMSKGRYDPRFLPRMSRAEPNLFSAILTVASRGEENLHRICYEHTKKCVADIAVGCATGVEGVEALLILSQWVPDIHQGHRRAGRGEEDRAAWMYIGSAIRTGFYLGIDTTAFKVDAKLSIEANERRRLAWICCYLTDRSVAVRSGRGFWARGPGPLSGLQSQDFPSLHVQTRRGGKPSDFLEASLELTQLFSNVHDILYASIDAGWQEMLTGRYAKFLDDFRRQIRVWMDKWEPKDWPTDIRACLMLDYHYLRLYVNAFAYQATMARILDSSEKQNTEGIPLIDSNASDARFVYEAIDAATDLLRTFRNIGADTLHYLPCRYMMSIVFGAVFLYKARATTRLEVNERADVRILVRRVIDHLKISTRGTHDMASRYARLLEALWTRNSPQLASRDILHGSPTNGSAYGEKSLQIPPAAANPQPSPNPASMYHGFVDSGLDFANGPVFSWLDLSGAHDFALQVPEGAGGSVAYGTGPDVAMMPMFVGGGSGFPF